MKILLLTKNNPVEIIDVVRRLNNHFNNMEKCIVVSPQLTAWMVEEAKGYPYMLVYYNAIKIVEKNKDELASKAENFIMVGTTDMASKSWYDIIVGIDNPDIEDYTDFPQENNVDHINCFSLKHADVIFNDFSELLTFLYKVMENKNELQ